MNGCNGRMGQFIVKTVAETDNCEIVCGIDINDSIANDFPVYKSLSEFDGKADVLIDFSHPSTLSSVLEYAKSTKTPAIICTTGLSAEQKAELGAASKEVAIFFSANMSLGVNVIIDLAKKATKVLEDNFDIEIIEKHHNQKVDAPSGTALMLADAVKCVDDDKFYTYGRNGIVGKRDKNEIGIHAVRGGGIVGEHQVIFASNFETITLTHQATDRSVFADGAVKAAQFIVNMPNGLYNMSDVINQK